MRKKKGSKNSAGRSSLKTESIDLIQMPCGPCRRFPERYSQGSRHLPKSVWRASAPVRRRFYQILEREYAVNREAARLSVTRDRLMSLPTERLRLNALRLVWDSGARFCSCRNVNANSCQVYHSDKLQNQGYTPEELVKFHDVIIELNRRAALV